MDKDIVKPIVLMLCAHEPTMDPRIRWEAEGAAREFEVMVVGFNRKDAGLPAFERVNGYALCRLPQIERGVPYYLLQLKNAVPRGVRICLMAMLLLLYPFLIVAELAFLALWALGSGVRSVARFLVMKPYSIRLIVAVVRRGFAMRDRPVASHSLSFRLQYVLAVLRNQFSPATFTFWNHIKDMGRKPDVVHCNDLDTLLVGVLAKQEYGCRLVYDAHEYYPYSDPDGRWLDQALFHFLEKFLIRRADAALTVNHLLADVMRSAYGIASFDSVPNVEPWSAGVRCAPPSRMSELAQGRVKFLVQGRYSPGRGYEELIDGWRAVDPSRAALFLRGPRNQWSDALEVRAAKLGMLDRNVYFLEPVSEDQLVAAAAEAEVGVIPYKGEVAGYKYACPNKLSQYLHAGAMVMSNDLPYVREVLEQSQAGLIYSLTGGEGVGEVVNRIISDPELLRRCRANALRFAEEEFNWQKLAQPLYRQYAAKAA